MDIWRDVVSFPVERYCLREAFVSGKFQSMKLTHADITNLFVVLQKLVKVDTNDGAKTRYQIARNIRTLSEVGKDIEATRQSVFAVPDRPEAQSEWDKFLATPYDGTLGLLKLKFESCKIEENNLSPAELAALLPVLEDCPE